MAQSDPSADTVVVAATATLIRSASHGRQSLSLYNNGTVTVYVGPTNAVAVATGMPIPAGAEREIRTTGAVYGIAASGTVDVRYWDEAVS